MSIRTLRGAITVSANTRQAILVAADQLVRALIEANEIQAEDVVSALFTVTDDLDAAYPAEAARALGWNEAGLLCLQEMAVKGSLSRVLRILVLWQSEEPQAAMQHCFLGEAASLRPDLADEAGPT